MKCQAPFVISEVSWSLFAPSIKAKTVVKFFLETILVRVIYRVGLKMGGFWLLVEFLWGRSAASGTTPSRLVH